MAEVPALTDELEEIRTRLLTDMRTAVRRKLIDDVAPIRLSCWVG